MKKLIIGLFAVAMIACSTKGEEKSFEIDPAKLTEEEIIEIEWKEWVATLSESQKKACGINIRDDKDMEELKRWLHELNVFWNEKTILICPRCKSKNVARIIYDNTFDLSNCLEEFKEKIKKGEIYPGGCWQNGNNSHCNNCQYEWKWKRNTGKV